MTAIKIKEKNAVVRSRINRQRKEQVARILKKLGMNHSEAINLFYAQIELLQGLPFNVCIPNKKTEKVLKESKKGKNVETFDTKEAFFREIEI